jgi:ribosomal protein S18 acetylase RimI-like enzyme
MRAELTDLKDLEEFLIKNEVECVGFSAWLREKITSTPHIRNDFTVFIKRNKNHAVGGESISEAVLITELGLIYPVVRKRTTAHLHDLHELEHFFRESPLHNNSIIGLAHSVEMIEKLVREEIRARVDYHLMFLKNNDADPAPRPLPRDVKIRQASILDALALYDLQKSYELEEVYLNPEAFNDTACYAFLKNSLRKEIIYIAERHGRPLAKAGTNARGYHVWQIGGVFTRQEERGKGLCLALMRTLLVDMFKNGKAACLFVKKSNRPAINLYKKLGFKIVDNFRITYFKTVD